MEYPQIDKYSGIDSFVHRWDPRLKIISFLFFAFSIALLPNIKLTFIAFCFAVFMVFASKLPFRFVLSYLKWLFLFMLFLFIVMPFTIGGEKILFSIWHLKATYKGLETAFLIALRAFSVAILIFVMLATTKFQILLKAMERLKFPNKLLQILMFSYRYIFVLLSEAQRSWNALHSRGFKMGNLPNVYTLKTVGKVIGMLFIRSYERSERVYKAMICRGYNGNIKTLEDFELKSGDVVLASMVVILAIFLHCLNLVI